MPLRRFLPQLAASMLLALFLAVASAQTTLIHGFNAPTLPVFATLTNFDGTNGASAAETSLIQGADGNFYGVAEVGGANSAGTVFRVTPSGVLTTLYTFCSQTNCTDGSIPSGGLVQSSNGNFYGVTVEGGVH